MKTAVALGCAYGSAGLTKSSDQRSDQSCPRTPSDGPHGEARRRAGCGKSARPVRRTSRATRPSDLRTIQRAELAECDTSLTTANDLAIRHAFEGAGVQFIDEDDGGSGVRLRQPQRKKA
jgi:hypothetical protein